jgi:phosphomevalonate kinase
MSDTVPETVAKWMLLVDRLVYYTTSEKINWKTSADEATFVARIGVNQVSFSRYDNSTNQRASDFVIKIFNSDGEVVDTFSDEDINGYYRTMKVLYENIVRRTNGSDEVLNAILVELPDPDDLPF